MKEYEIAVIPGDDVCVKVSQEATKVAEAAARNSKISDSCFHQPIPNQRNDKAFV